MSVHFLHTIRATHVAQAGGKAASLGELLHAGHPVPPAFVVTTDEHQLSPTLSAAILAAFDELGTQRVAVRSSGVGEDGQDQSWAGQFATLLHVERDSLLPAIQACWDSTNTARVAAYADGESLKLAVLVQQMVDSDVAGVAFSANPITGNNNEMIIEAVYGLGELLVQGTVTPDNFLLDKQTGKVIDQDIAEKTILLAYRNNRMAEQEVPIHLQRSPALSRRQLAELATLTCEVELYYGYPVDIEWAFEAGKLYLLQARPITTL
jgi:phosphoenolpyruvate synthase/pyruvate phosphate dikinase